MAQHTNNNHYIPKVLIRRFSNKTGERFYCEKGKICKRDAKKIFSADNIYNDKLERTFNFNESKLKEIFNCIDDELKIKPSVLSREITIPEWTILIYNSKDNYEDIATLNEFFLRMNLKFFAANTNENHEEIVMARKASTSTNLTGSDNIVFIRYNFDFCPFVLPVNIPVILPVGMNIVFATPISKDTLMLHYCNRNTLDAFIQKYRYKHLINLAMIHSNTPNGIMLCDFVCSDIEYAKRLIETKS